MTKLHPDGARALNSREISKVISGLLGSLIGWCDVNEILTAIDHMSENKDHYKKAFEFLAKNKPYGL